MKILVTSLNLYDKLDAVFYVFQKAFSLEPQDLKVTGTKTDSGIPGGQPYGFSSTYQGALTRLTSVLTELQLITSAMPESEDYDYIVSIENGIETLTSDEETIYLDFPIVIIYHCKSKERSVQFGQSRPILLDQMRKMKEEGIDHKEIGAWCQKWYQKHDFSKSRRDIICDCLQMGLESYGLTKFKNYFVKSENRFD